MQCLQKQNQEGARIHAENAIREKNQALHFLKLGARLDAVTQRVQTAVTMQQVTVSMKGVVTSHSLTLSPPLSQVLCCLFLSLIRALSL